MARHAFPSRFHPRRPFLVFGLYGAFAVALLVSACGENTERVIAKIPEAPSASGAGPASGGAPAGSGGETPTDSGGTGAAGASDSSTGVGSTSTGGVSASGGATGGDTTGGTSAIATGQAIAAAGSPVGYASIGTGGTSGGRKQAALLVKNCTELEAALTANDNLAVIAIGADKTIDCTDPNPPPNCAAATLANLIAGCSTTCMIACDSTTGDTTRPTYRPLDPSFKDCYDLNKNNSDYKSTTPMVPMTNTVKKIYVRSNKTLIGLNNASTLKGANLILNSDASNVIIQNLNFDQVNPALIEAGDAISIDGAHHVWIDHCKFSNVSDADIDVTNGTFITYSWNYFYGTNNYACSGKQNSTSTISGSGQSTVTIHHNYFENTLGCSPKVTDTSKVHIFNNVWQSVGYYSIQVANQAQATIQNNLFSDSKKPYYNSDSCLTKSSPCSISASGNQFDGISTTETQDTGGTVTALPYDSTTYTLDDAKQTGFKDGVTQNAGPTLTVQ